MIDQNIHRRILEVERNEESVYSDSPLGCFLSKDVSLGYKNLMLFYIHTHFLFVRREEKREFLTQTKGFLKKESRELLCLF